MSGAGYIPIADPGRRATQQLYEHQYECDLCTLVCITSSGLWAHIKACHPDILPQSEEDQEKLRAEKKALCRKKTHNSLPDSGERSGIKMIREPPPWRVPIENLIVEVQRIYPGILMVEEKCREAAGRVMAGCGGGSPKLDDTQWKAFIDLHNVALREYYNFLRASQHPAAHPPLRQLTVKYRIPARMCRYGILGSLELLHRGLPHSRERMIEFTYSSYKLMGYMCEGFPEFELTWSEAMANLAGYRTLLGDSDFNGRGTWARTGRALYSKLTDKMPCVGRLYYRLAMLSKPEILDQFSYYCRSLDVSSPFLPAREDISTLFNSVSTLGNDTPRVTHRDVGRMFVQLHGSNFAHTLNPEKLDYFLSQFADTPDAHIREPSPEQKVPDACMAVCNITGLYNYGAKDSILRFASREGGTKERVEDAPPALLCDVEDTCSGLYFGDTPPPPLPEMLWSEICVGSEIQRESGESVAEIAALSLSKQLAYGILGVALHQTKDSNVPLPHIHVWLVFLAYITCFAPAISLLEDGFPWEALVFMLNSLLAGYEFDRFENNSFPVPEEGIAVPLPEDYTLRGLDWASKYFPSGWFQAVLDDALASEDRAIELPSMEKARIERILWLAVRISTNGEWLVYSDRHFEVHPALVQRTLVKGEM